MAYTNYLNQQANKAFIKQQAKQVNPTTTPITPTIQFFFPAEIPTLPEEEKVETVYDTNILNTVVEKINNRQPISETDQAAKTKALSLLPQGEESGPLYQSSNLSIDYIGGTPPDWFLVEIMTTDIAKAKKETVDWFLNNGFSQNFICDYPVDFYLSSEIKDKLMNNNTNELFSSLAPGCQ